MDIISVEGSNGFRIRGYIDTDVNCRQFSLLIWTLFIGKFVHPIGRGGDGVNGVLEGGELLF